MKPSEIDAAQLATSAAYAVTLESLKKRLTSDDTWKQVVIGVSYTLGFVSLRLRQRQGWTPEQAERVIWRSFFFSGLPIIVWQNVKAWQNRAAAEARMAAWPREDQGVSDE